MFLFYMKKYIISPVFLLSVMLLTASALIGAWPLDQQVIYLHQYSFYIGVEVYFMPVVTVLPVCFLQSEMQCRHAELFYVERTTRKRYLLSGIAGAALCGLLIMFFAFILFTISCFLLSNPSGISFDVSLNQYGYDNLSGFRLYLYSGLVYCLNGLIHPVIAYTVLHLTLNAYLAVSMPFILRTLISFTVQHLEIPPLYLIDAGQMKLSSHMADHWPGHGISYVFLYTGLVMALCYLINCRTMEKRYEGS